MLPLPFIKVPAKSFKRNLDGDDDSSDTDTGTGTGTTSTTVGDSTRNSSSLSSSSASSSSTANSAIIKDLRRRSFKIVTPFADVKKKESHSNASSSGGHRVQGRRPSMALSPSGSAEGLAEGSPDTPHSSWSSSHSSSSTFSSPSGSSASTSSKSGGKSKDGETGTASSGFSLVHDLDPNDGPLNVVLEGAPASAHVAAAISAGIYTARSSIKSTKTYKSSVRGFKRARRAARLTLKIGELIVTKGVVAPLVQRGVREWRSFQAYRDRQKAGRRNRTLDWFEDRAKQMRQEEDREKQRQQNKRRALWCTHLKQERTVQQQRDLVSETRKEAAAQRDAQLAHSKEQEKIRNYFLENNGRWQNDILTRKVDYIEQQERKDGKDAHADILRNADVRRKAAAEAYLVEYDEGEAVTQATLRIMRRSGIIAGVNAPPPDIEDPPLETDTYLLLKLRVGLQGTQVNAPAGKPTLAANSTAIADDGGRTEIGEKIDKQLLPGSQPRRTTTASIRKYNVADQPSLGATSGTPELFKSTITEKTLQSGGTTNVGVQPTPSNPIKAPTRGRGGGGGGSNRGKKISSGAFEVDLLRFRGVQEMRGWRLGPVGGESLAADLTSGACPRLLVLRLGWCLLGDRGTRAVVRALSGGGASAAGRTLQELDLRGNGVTAGGCRNIGEALAAGALPALRRLDLRANALRDEGGKAVAHFLLSGMGTWPKIVLLDLSSNGMRDAGVEAVFKAVTAPGVSLAPDIEKISVRDNYTSPAARKLTCRPPPFLHM